MVLHINIDLVLNALSTLQDEDHILVSVGKENQKDKIHKFSNK